MAGVTITDVKVVVDRCSKCRRKEDKIPTDKNGRPYEDKEVSCINCSLGNKVVILDDNELSIMAYAEEYPENWKKICEALDERRKKDVIIP